MDEKEIQELLKEFAVKIIYAMRTAEKISGLKVTTPHRKLEEVLKVKVPPHTPCRSELGNKESDQEQEALMRQRIKDSGMVPAIEEVFDAEKEDRVIDKGDFAGAMKYGRCLGYLEGSLQKVICDMFTWKKDMPD